MKETFPKAARFKKRVDFQRQVSIFVKGEYLTFAVMEGSGRLGISISRKKVKQAVKRNRIKRLIREIFRKRRQSYLTYDIHAIYSSRGSLDRIGLSDIESDFLKLRGSLKK